MSAIARTAASTVDALRVFVLATLMTLLAFVGLQGQQVQEESTTQDDVTMVRVANNAPVTLDVANYNWLDMRIYAIRAGQRFRLGTVNSFNEESFELPVHLQADIAGVQILAVPIGGARAHVSPHLTAGPGEVLQLNLETNLNLSAFYVAGVAR